MGSLTDLLDDSYILQPSIPELWLQTSCERANITFQTNINPTIESNGSLMRLVPSTTYRISKDGNCLFGSLSALLSGNEQHKSTLRELLCNEMAESPITTEQLKLFSEQTSLNWREYLAKNNMRNNGVWVGDIEVAVFCHVFKVEVVVYVLSLQKWVVYLKGAFAERRNMFLINWGNHWEPVASLCLKNSAEPLFITSISLPNFPSNFHSFRKRLLISCDGQIERKKVKNGGENPVKAKFFSQSEFLHNSDKCNHRNFKLGLQAKNTSADFEESTNIKVQDFVTNRKCHKCCRVSTKWYPLELKLYVNTAPRKRNFGEPLPAGECELCSECYSYTTETQSSWSNAWPSVLYSLCFISENPHVVSLFLKLPIQIKASWLFLVIKVKDYFKQSSLFQDITRDVLENKNLLNTYLVCDFKKAMEQFSLPSVECFCGASEFIDSAGSLPFNHLINFVDESFSSFRANWRDNIRCIRSDFLDKRDKLVVFAFSPAIVVSELGLCLCTCELHSKGSKKRGVHVPNHPVVGNLCHASGDRLAPLVPSLRGAKPTKLGEFSNTFTMSKSVGGLMGVGSISLHNQRNLNVDSNFLLPGLESTFLQNRHDMTENLTSLASEYNLSEEFCKGLASPQMYSEQELQHSLKAATYIPMNTILKLKNQNDEADEETFSSLKNAVVYNDFTSTGVRPPLLSSVLVKKFYFVSLLFFLFSTVSELSNSIIDKTSAAWQQLSRIVAKPCKREFKKFCDMLKIPNNATSLKCWSCAEKQLSNLKVVPDFNGIKTLPENVEICVVCFRRPVSIRLSAIDIPEPFQISASETTPGRNLFNLQLYRFSPRPSTVHCNLTIPKIINDAEVDFHSELENLRVVILTKKTRVPFGIINLFSGQFSVRCPDHELPLCCDYKDSGFRCAVRKCKNLSKWRCPEKVCIIAVCQKHLESVNDNEKWPVLQMKHDQQETEIDSIEACDVQKSEDNPSSEDDDPNFVDPFDDFMFIGPSCAENQIGETLDTDAGHQFVSVEPTTESDLDFLPIQMLFNVFLAVLNRPKSPVKGNLKFRRFMQSFVARNSKTSISLMQPESLLFPSIFFKQLNDGSAAGALPFFLFGSDSKCASYGFAGLLEHFRTRITDVSLMTTAKHQYIQFAVDCLINLQLKSTHSKVFFQRGLQSLKVITKKKDCSASA